MTSVEFEYKWVRDPGGILAGDQRRFEVARAAYAIRQRMGEGMSADNARDRVLEEPYYRDALKTAYTWLPQTGEYDVWVDFNAIDAP